ncbi:MAG: hypothetical protein WCK31_00310 [bacterium]
MEESHQSVAKTDIVEILETYLDTSLVERRTRMSREYILTEAKSEIELGMNVTKSALVIVDDSIQGNLNRYTFCNEELLRLTTCNSLLQMKVKNLEILQNQIMKLNSNYLLYPLKSFARNRLLRIPSEFDILKTAISSIQSEVDIFMNYYPVRFLESKNDFGCEKYCSTTSEQLIKDIVKTEIVKLGDSLQIAISRGMPADLVRNYGILLEDFHKNCPVVA